MTIVHGPSYVSTMFRSPLGLHPNATSWPIFVPQRLKGQPRQQPSKHPRHDKCSTRKEPYVFLGYPRTTTADYDSLLEFSKTLCRNPSCAFHYLEALSLLTLLPHGL